MADQKKKVKWTPAQEAVIGHRHGNLLVSAAAGSGKTAVLIEHILTRICDENSGTDIDRLLVVTFTRAAAAEMRERLYKGLNKRLDDAEKDCALGLVKPEKLRHLQRQLKLLPRAMVCTIDSFCMNVVQNHISLLDLDPAFRIADQDEAAMLQDEVMTALLEAEYEEGREEFLNFAESFMSSKDDGRVREAVKNLYDLSEQSVDPDALLDGYLDCYTVEDKETLRALPWFRKMKEDKENGDDYASVIDEDLILSEARLTAPAAKELVRLAKAFRRAYQEEKNARKLADFSDLSRYCTELLYDGNKRSDVAAALSAQFDEILIDEYQDSNDLQETILTAISREKDGHPNIVMVGDAKQSIYGFRNARPQLFMEKHRTYRDSGDYKKIELNKNFRSRSEVLEASNTVFSQIMHAAEGGIDYTDDVKLYPGGEFPEKPGNGAYTAGKAKALLLDLTDRNSDADQDKVDLEARMVGEEILKITDPESGMLISDGNGNYRRAEFRDIVILTRKATSNTNFIACFESMNIPVYAESRESFYNTWEVSLVIDFLSVIDNELNDYPLYALLHSPVFGFSDAELACIRISADRKNVHGPFFHALKAFAEDPEEDLKELGKKAEDFLNTMEKYVRLSGVMSITSLLRMFYEETGIFEFVSAMPAGRQRARNLEELLIRAERFEKTSYQGIFNFLRYVEEHKKTDNKDGEPSVQEEGGNVVRLMTIHKSKGLEFPIVFVCLLGKTYQGFVTTELYKKNYEYGFALPAFDLKERTTGPSVFGKFIAAQNEKEERGEEQRLLYVAMTRAKEQLYLTAGYQLTSKGNILRRQPDYLMWLDPVFKTPEGQEQFEIVRMTVDDLAAIDEERQQKKAVEKEELLKELYENRTKTDTLSAQLSYNYLYNDLYRIPATLSVSRLKHMTMEEEGVSIAADGAPEDPYAEAAAFDDVPVTDDEAGKDVRETKHRRLTGAERGTLYHYAMEFLERDESAEKMLSRIEKEGLISALEKDTINNEKLDRFRRSSLAGRFFDAKERGQAFRERKFIVGFPAADVLKGKYDNIPDGARIMVQGIIDMYFEEADGLVIVDYKTDRVKEEAELTARYHSQLELYAKALEQITDKKVKETWIYSFSLDKAILTEERSGS